MGLAERLAAYSPFRAVLANVIDDRVVGVALVDREGRTVGREGEIAEDAMPLVALVLYRLKTPDLSTRLFAGEVLTFDLDGSAVAVAVAKKQLFVVAMLKEATLSSVACVDQLRDSVSRMLYQDTPETTPELWGGGGGSGSGPAQLPVIEWGVTVPRGKA